MAGRAGRKKATKSEKHERRSHAELYKLALVAVITYALVYSLVFLEGPSYFGDHTTYLNLAHAVLQGTYVENSYIFSVRLLNIFPTALFYELLGVNLLSDSLWDIISFIGIILVSFYMGRELYSDFAGILAAVLACFFPAVLQLATTVSDDVPMAFITAFAMLALLYGIRRHSNRWYFGAGALFLASILVTPEGTIIDVVAGVYLLAMLLSRKIKLDKTFLYLPAGFFFCMVLLFIFNYAVAGNPLITFGVNYNFYSAVGQPGTIPSTDTNPMFYISNMFPYRIISTLYTNIQQLTLNPITIWEQMYVVNYNNVGFFFYAVVIAAAYLLIKREGKAYFALFYLAATFLYLEFGPMHASLFPFSYLLSYRLARFLTILAVPTVVVLGIALARAVEKDSVTRRRIAIAIVSLSLVFLVVTAIPINFMWYQITHYETYDQMAIANYLNALPNTTVVYFPYSHPNIPIYMHFDNSSRIVAYQTKANCSNVTDNSYIVIPTEPQFGINYTEVVAQCPSWEQIYIPPIPGNYPSYVTGGTNFSLAKLYYVP